MASIRAKNGSIAAGNTQKLTEKVKIRPCMKKWSDGGLGENWEGLGDSRGTPRTIRRHTNEVSQDLVLQDIRNPTFQHLCQHWDGYPTLIRFLCTSYSLRINLLFTSDSTSNSPLIHKKRFLGSIWQFRGFWLDRNTRKHLTQLSGPRAWTIWSRKNHFPFRSAFSVFPCFSGFLKNRPLSRDESYTIFFGTMPIRTASKS